MRKLGETKHLFVDLDSVKKDILSMNFFYRKEDGTRFFNPRLIRNIKLVSDFGLNVGKEEEKDPLFDLTTWRIDSGYHKGASPLSICFTRYCPIPSSHLQIKRMIFVGLFQKRLLLLS